MNRLEEYFYSNKGRLIHKWKHYFEVYDRHFSRFRGQPIVILEIGVSQGGSLQMWKDYFGPNAKIYGIDINPKCSELEEENIKIFIGSQSDRCFLRNIKEQVPPIDILIDDGGHTMRQQIVSFEELFTHIKDDGIYLCEDVHTAYWLQYGGGHKRMGSFIEYSKNFIDYINAWHSKQHSLKVNEITKSVFSAHFYDSIVVLEKRRMEPPYAIKTGNPSFDTSNEKPSLFSRMKTRLLSILNRLLMALRLPSIGF